MPAQVAGFPFWDLSFDEQGQQVDPAAINQFLAEAGGPGGPGDLFVFSHGWNNTRADAATLYANFFTQMRHLLDAPPAGVAIAGGPVGTAGVFWPAIVWPDEAPVAHSSGGAVGLGTVHMGAAGPAGVPVQALRTVFSGPGEPELVASLAAAIAARERSDDALLRFRAGLRTLMAGSGGLPAIGDDSAELAVGAPEQIGGWKQQLCLLGAHERLDVGPGGGGAAGLSDVFDQLWAGAKGALRIASYWRMKARAGVVGQSGLGPLLGRLAARSPGLRVHLIGHSFGARLVSFALAGLPAGADPVKSLLLLQGAFSHFSFADALPFDSSRGGALKGMAGRVDGPLMATFTAFDMAVGRAYPLASELAGQDASALPQAASRWGGMGSDGAQAVNAAVHLLGPAGTRYAFAHGAWLNLDSNAVIRIGGPPGGAHGDIVHPETAWAALAGAGVLLATG